MAPEQAAGDIHNVGPPADVYALGTDPVRAVSRASPISRRLRARCAEQSDLRRTDPSVEIRDSGSAGSRDDLPEVPGGKNPVAVIHRRWPWPRTWSGFRLGSPSWPAEKARCEKTWRKVRKRWATATLVLALLSSIAIAGWLSIRAGSDRETANLTRQIDDELAAADWPKPRRDKLEELIARSGCSIRLQPTPNNESCSTGSPANSGPRSSGRESPRRTFPSCRRMWGGWRHAIPSQAKDLECRTKRPPAGLATGFRSVLAVREPRCRFSG